MQYTLNNRRLPLLMLALGAAAAHAARDPFLPIDYAPPVPVTEAPAEPEAPVAPPPPVQPAFKPVTPAEWTEARKAVKISGVTKSVNPSTGVTVVQAMINRRPCAVGETVTLVREDIRFQWRVESISDQTVLLNPLKAERFTPQNNALKGNQ